MENKRDIKRERTCVACRRKSHKSALYRIVRAPEGDVAFDFSGRAAGRGAYVCGVECFEKIAESGRLAQALRAQVPADKYGSLKQELIEHLQISEVM